MTPEQEQRMNELCERIQAEKDPEKFDQLVQALNNLLATEERQIHQDWKNDPSVLKKKVS